LPHSIILFDIVNHKGNECTWQAVSGDHYFKFFILRSADITIQKVRGTVSGVVLVQRGRCGNTIASSKTIVKLSKRPFSEALWFEE